jgi:hypothetical protein
MGSDGRIEKRATVKILVHIIPMEGGFIAETTTTVNISRGGVRIVTNRRWRPGERMVLTSLSGEFRRQGRVIHCNPLTDGQFCVGLEFDANIKNWEGAAWVSAN